MIVKVTNQQRDQAGGARRARRIIGWSLLFIVAFQIAFFVFREYWQPAVADPEYGRKLRQLRNRLKETPEGQPLVVALGSSRVAMGFRPDCLQTSQSPTYNAATVFNFALCGAGPIMELVCLHRLLADGIHPDKLVVEIWPPLLTQQFYEDHEAKLLDANLKRFRARDLPVLCRYHPQPRDACLRWSKEQLLSQSYSLGFLEEYAPRLVPQTMRNDSAYRHMDDWGHLQVEGYQNTVDSETFRQRVKVTWDAIGPGLKPFRLSSALDQAQRDLLQLARQEKIPVLLVIMPEPVPVRALYPRTALDQIAKYLLHLQEEFAVAVVDARDWVPDDGFADGHHMTPAGATCFTRRFDETLRRFVASSAVASVVSDGNLPATPAIPKVKTGGTASKVDFNREIRPILATTCFSCHGQDASKRKAGLRLDDKVQVFGKLRSAQRELFQASPWRAKSIAESRRLTEHSQCPQRSRESSYLRGRSPC